MGNTSCLRLALCAFFIAVAAVPREKLLSGCGEICDTSVQPPPGQCPAVARSGIPSCSLRKHVQCLALFLNKDADAPAQDWPPPEDPPDEFRDDFLMGGGVGLEWLWRPQHYSGSEGAHTDRWTQSYIDYWILRARFGTLPGTYGWWETRKIQNMIFKHQLAWKGKRLLVVGSESPWLESMLLLAGAEHVTTVEYGKLARNPHPRISTMTPAELAAAFIAGSPPTFDGGASYSSIEHSGLGRYGDTVNPWADLQVMAKIWCVMRPGAMFLIGVESGSDTLVWHAHRVYGPRRWPHLMANWQHVDSAAPIGGLRHSAALYMKMEQFDGNGTVWTSMARINAFAKICILLAVSIFSQAWFVDS